MRQLRVNVYDSDPYNSRLFEALLSARGYEVLAFPEAAGCPVYSGEQPRCLALRPCADIVIVDNRMPLMSGVELLMLHAVGGCGIDPRNKAVAAAQLDYVERRALDGLGCTFIRKPFRVGALYTWLGECEKRVDLSQPLGVPRKERRIPAMIDVRFQSGLEGPQQAGKVVNYSGRGLCLEAAAPLQPRQSVLFSTALPNCCTSAAVRWVEARPGTHLAGLLAQ